MATSNKHTVIYDDKEYVIIIEKKPYVLNNTIQPVYKYYHFSNELNSNSNSNTTKEILTYYTNGCDKVLFPVYYDLKNYPRTILDILLKNLLPE